MLRSIFGRRSVQSVSRSVRRQGLGRARKLQVESLGNRELLAAGISLISSTLYINGTESADSVAVTTIYRGVPTGSGLLYSGTPFVYATVKDSAGNTLADYETGGFNVSKISIMGYGGQDTIAESSSIDTYVDGGEGSDDITTGSGNDVVMAGAGADVVHTGQGADSVWGSTGNDTIYAGAGNDVIMGEDGQDSLFGEGGDDFVYGNDGKDALDGGSGNDVMTGGNADDTLTGGSGNDSMMGDDGADELYGNDGNDSMYGGSGNDSLYAGAGSDLMYGMDDRDLLVSIDADQSDTLYGGNGTDNFWVDKSGSKTDTTDATASETSGLWLHQVSSFANGADKTLNGDNIADPSDAGMTANFSDRPLFASGGPSDQDIDQGGVGDCWLMSGLGSMAQANQESIVRSVADLGDGTYGVAIGSSFYRVDGDMPVDSSGNLKYANLGVDDSVWVAVIEKAYAAYRDNANTYSHLGGGRCQPVYESFGGKNTGSTTFADNKVTNALDFVISKMAGNQAISTLIKNAGSSSSLVNNHWYMIESVDKAHSKITVRNPWGNSGTGANNLLVTVDASEWVSAMSNSNGLEYGKV